MSCPLTHVLNGLLQEATCTGRPYRGRNKQQNKHKKPRPQISTRQESYSLAAGATEHSAVYQSLACARSPYRNRLQYQHVITPASYQHSASIITSKQANAVICYVTLSKSSSVTQWMKLHPLPNYTERCAAADYVVSGYAYNGYILSHEKGATQQNEEYMGENPLTWSVGEPQSCPACTHVLHCCMDPIAGCQEPCNTCPLLHAIPPLRIVQHSLFSPHHPFNMIHTSLAIPCHTPNRVGTLLTSTCNPPLPIYPIPSYHLVQQ
jgi:hypothetical protein